MGFWNVLKHHLLEANVTTAPLSLVSCFLAVAILSLRKDFLVSFGWRHYKAVEYSSLIETTATKCEYTTCIQKYFGNPVCLYGYRWSCELWNKSICINIYFQIYTYFETFICTSSILACQFDTINQTN